jgi:hypothetical protein
MYWHESTENDPPNRWLREQIKKVVDESLPASEPVLRRTARSSEKTRPTPQLLRRKQ